MPRKHRRSRPSELSDLSRLAHGGASPQVRRGREWFVREIPSHRAEKAYRCPDCQSDIPPGQAHVVAWSAEGLFGDAASVRDRRHYHAHCWRLA